MEATGLTLILALIGTAVCALGFAFRPGSTIHLVRPIFVIPAMIWTATFGKVIYRKLTGDPYQEPSFDFGTYVAQHGNAAMTFIILCVLGFFAGYLLPFGERLGRLSHAVYVPVPRFKAPFRKIGITIALIMPVWLVAVSGMDALTMGWQNPGFKGPAYLAVGVSGPAMFALIGVAAACLGAGLPARLRDDPGGALLCILCLFLVATPLMANFSRGSGVPFAVALIGYAVQHATLKKRYILLTVAVVLWLATSGLQGRGAFGHRGGVGPFLQFAFTHTLFEPQAWIGTLFSGGDGFTPTCTTMAAIASGTWVGQMPATQWLLMQIPVPRGLFGLPDWTVKLTYFLGGVGKWGYTTSVFGDLFLHFRWAGPLLFIPIGIVYRGVDYAAFKLSYFNPTVINPLSVLLATSYLAMFQALFNSYRAWLTIFFYSIYLVVLGLYLVRLFFMPSNYRPLLPGTA